MEENRELKGKACQEIREKIEKVLLNINDVRKLKIIYQFIVGIKGINNKKSDEHN